MQIGDLSALRYLRRDRPPVVLLGGLNVVRALGLGGIPVIVASPEHDEPALFSRYCVARWPLPPLQEPQAVLEALESLAARLRGIFPSPSPLFFSNDVYLGFVDAFREPLAAKFRMLLNDARTTRALLDKDRFAEFAIERGLPAPRVLRWNGRGADRLEGHAGPVLAKPAAKHEWDKAPGLAALFDANKARIYSNGAGARSDAALQHLWQHVVFHQYVPGDDRELWCFDGVTDAQGRMLACHTGRKLRCAPPLTGDSSYIELAANSHIEAAGREVAARVPLAGIFNMDFKRDPSSGRYCLLEINARCNLWNYIGARNGLNLAKVYYDYLVRGERPSRTAYRARYRWLDFKLDRGAYRALAREGRLTLPGWIASLATPKVYAVFAWRDPNPLLQMVLRRLGNRFARSAVAKMPLSGL